MKRQTSTTNTPMIPVPTTLGGGLMPLHTRGQAKPNTCSVPGCSAASLAKCRFVLENTGGDRMCGKNVCGHHLRAAGVGAGCCPSHVRWLERRQG
jgi:hypothetical protein